MSTHRPTHRPLPRLLLVIALLASVCLPLAFSEVPAAYAADLTFTPFFFGGAKSTRSLAIGDLNSDGRLDIVAGGVKGQSAVYLNDGAGGFITQPFGGADDIISVAVGDLNGDGWLDIVAGNSGPSKVYLNDGAGGFITQPFGDADYILSVAVGDLNGDGWLDIVAGSLRSQSAVYLNDGAGGFAAHPFGEVDNTISVAVGDLNGDGWLDIVAGNNTAQSKVYLNDGAGGFTAQPFGGRDYTSTTSVAVGDLNGDGRLDIVAGNSAQNEVYLNDGAGGFTAQPFGGVGDYTFSVAVGDLNGDGWLDIVAGNNTAQSKVYLNDGAGGFTAQPFGGVGDYIFSVAVGDFNGDAWLDIVVGYVGLRTAVYLNDGASGFSTQPFGEANDCTAISAVGDLNGDGWLDIVAGSPSKIYLNDGTGSYRDADYSFGGALGDLNGDGRLDIVGRSGPRSAVHLNDGMGGFITQPFGEAGDYSLAVGDFNGDGWLDIVTGNYNIPYSGPSKVYLNDGAGGFTTQPFGEAGDYIRGVAVGDLNGDGWLDIVAGNWDQSEVYLNDGAGRFTAQPLGGMGNTISVAVGDLNGDGWLDIIAGNSDQSAVYLNDGAGRFTAQPLGGADNTASVAVGDLNGDGWLDIIAGNSGLSKIYLNDGAGGFTTQPLGGRDYTTSVAVGDLNGDGWLDIIAGKYGQQCQIYLNGIGHAARLPNNPPTVAITRPGRTADANFFSTSEIIGDATIPITYTLSDPEGDPTGVVTGTYSLDGGGNWRTAVAATTPLTSTSAALTFDGVDDYVSVASPAVPLGNEPYTIETWIKPDTMGTRGIVGWGNFGVANQVNALRLSNDGLVNSWWGNDLIVTTGVLTGTWHHVAATFDGATRRIYLDGVLKGNDTPTGHNVPSNSNFRIGAPNNDAFDGAIDEVRVWNVARTQAQIQANMRQVLAGSEPGLTGYWRLDERKNTIAHDQTANHADGVLGGGVAARRPIWTGGAPRQHVYQWDTFKSGVFGQSDNVVFRIVAYPDLHPQPNGVPGPYQRPYASATTFPFRVRGTQVRVVDQQGNGVPDALVYRLPPGQARGAQAIAAANGQLPYRTGSQGYLQGRGVLTVARNNNPDTSDRLVALRPVVVSDTYTLYQTSAPIVPNAGPQLAPVTTPGVQTLAVSPDHPLLLFDLDVALEWDARNDPSFLTRLESDLRRTSEVLYDWTDGQIALGNITLYHDAKRVRFAGGRNLWDDANIRIYATNRLRPNANKGGVVVTQTLDPDISSIDYNPGQVRIGAVWNRYGESDGTIGEDWPRTLAHELGHYLLFLDDNYIGLDDHGRLAPVAGCRGAMDNPYRDDYSEFHPRDAEWLVKCRNTLSERTTGRADWETIGKLYPNFGLRAPASYDVDGGPGLLPLAVTQVRTAEPDPPVGAPPPAAVEAPIFSLEQAGSAVQPGADARAFLFYQDGRWLTDLGRPILDRVEARGAAPGDRVCVYELAAARLGCSSVTNGNQPIALERHTGWQPEVAVTPVTSRTLTISVTNLLGDLNTLKARLYPVNAPALDAINLTWNGSGYAATLSPAQLADPVFEGYVRVWVDDGSGRETVVDFTMGGNPGRSWSRGAPRGSPGRSWSRGTPVISGDGQVIVYTDNVDFAEGQFYAIQTAAQPPYVPAWAALVGRAYRLTATADAPDLTRASISISYLAREVSDGAERWLKIYFWNGLTWEPLPSTLDQAVNSVSAPARGPGLYAVMASIDLPPFASAGWQQFSYPINDARPVAEALSSIDGRYRIVYHDRGRVSAPRWQVYAGDAPAYVNDLKQLEFARSYQIRVTEPVTISLKPVTSSAALPADVATADVPATFYGVVRASTEFTPTEGMPVIAYINGIACGRGATRLFADQIVYKVSVEADSLAMIPGCGAPGRIVRFQVGERVMATSAAWNNDIVSNLPLEARVRQLYLPLIER